MSDDATGSSSSEEQQSDEEFINTKEAISKLSEQDDFFSDETQGTLKQKTRDIFPYIVLMRLIYIETSQKLKSSEETKLFVNNCIRLYNLQEMKNYDSAIKDSEEDGSKEMKINKDKSGEKDSKKNDAKEQDQIEMSPDQFVGLILKEINSDKLKLSADTYTQFIYIFCFDKPTKAIYNASKTLFSRDDQQIIRKALSEIIDEYFQHHKSSPRLFLYCMRKILNELKTFESYVQKERKKKKKNKYTLAYYSVYCLEKRLEENKIDITFTSVTGLFLILFNELAYTEEELFKLIQCINTEQRTNLKDILETLYCNMVYPLHKYYKEMNSEMKFNCKEIIDKVKQERINCQIENQIIFQYQATSIRKDSISLPIELKEALIKNKDRKAICSIWKTIEEETFSSFKGDLLRKNTIGLNGHTFDFIKMLETKVKQNQVKVIFSEHNFDALKLYYTPRINENYTTYKKMKDEEKKNENKKKTPLKNQDCNHIVHDVELFFNNGVSSNIPMVSPLVVVSWCSIKFLNVRGALGNKNEKQLKDISTGISNIIRSFASCSDFDDQGVILMTVKIVLEGFLGIKFDAEFKEFERKKEERIKFEKLEQKFSTNIKRSIESINALLEELNDTPFCRKEDKTLLISNGIERVLKDRPFDLTFQRKISSICPYDHGVFQLCNDFSSWMNTIKNSLKRNNSTPIVLVVRESEYKQFDDIQKINLYKKSVTFQEGFLFLESGKVYVLYDLSIPFLLNSSNYSGVHYIYTFIPNSIREKVILFEQRPTVLEGSTFEIIANKEEIPVEHILFTDGVYEPNSERYISPADYQMRQLITLNKELLEQIGFRRMYKKLYEDFEEVNNLETYELEAYKELNSNEVDIDYILEHLTDFLENQGVDLRILLRKYITMCFSSDKMYKYNKTYLDLIKYNNRSGERHFLIPKTLGELERHYRKIQKSEKRKNDNLTIFLRRLEEATELLKTQKNRTFEVTDLFLQITGEMSITKITLGYGTANFVTVSNKFTHLKGNTIDERLKNLKEIVLYEDGREKDTKEIIDLIESKFQKYKEEIKKNKKYTKNKKIILKIEDEIEKLKGKEKPLDS